MSWPGTRALVSQYFRARLPHIWCAGCAHGIVTRALVQAVAELGLDPDRTVVVSGIGCAGRASGYLNFPTLHTTHGRALAFATGIKAARPELTVLVISGDGDAAAIGGNHLIHAARRNIDLTLVVYQNAIYGMTGGQYAPTTPEGFVTSTSRHGHAERPFDLAALACGAGATFAARSTAYHFDLTVEVIKQAVRHRGFSFVEVVSSCPTYAGRLNGMEGGARALEWMRERAVLAPAAPRREGDFAIGVLRRSDAPEWTEAYRARVAGCA